MSSTDTILSAARDWTVRPIADGVELANPFGQVLASASLALSTQWHQEADRAGQVAVIYGPMVGVRSPQGRAYHDADRFAELRDACLRGFVAAALVNWSADDRPFDSPTSAQRRPGWPLQPDEETLLAEKKVSRLRTVRLTVSDALSDTIAPEHLQPLLTHLWPVNCQTCSYALGAHADINVDAERRDELVVTMHHGTCRPSGTHGTTLTRPTRAIAVGRVPMDAEPSAADLPTVVINPSCEQLLLARDRNGGWRDATLDRFKRLRFAAPGPQFPRQARHTSVQLVGDGLEITVTGRRTGASRWSLDSCPAEVREQIERVSGIAVVLTTAVLPTRLTLAELEAALTDPESLVAWVRLRHS